MKSTSGCLKEFLGSAHVFAAALTNVLESRLLDQLTRKQLTYGQIKVLQLVARAETQNVGEIAVFLGVSGAAASKTVDKLVRGGWLRRQEYSTDRRAMEISLTRKGQRLLRSYESARLRSMAIICRDMGNSELELLSRRLNRLSAHIVSQTVQSDDVCLQCGIHLREHCVLHEESGKVCSFRRNSSRHIHAPSAAAD